MIRWIGLAGYLVVLFLLSADPVIFGQDKNSPIRRIIQVNDVEGKSLSEWITAVRNPDASLRERAISALPIFGKTAGNTEVINLLLERFEDRDASPRLRAVMVMNLLEIPREDRSRVVKGLIGRLGDQQGLIRFHAALGLQRFGEDARPAVPQLCTLAEDGISWEIRKAALSTLIVAAHNPKGAPEKGSVQAMYRRSSDVASEVRMEVAKGLGALGRTTIPEVDRGVDGVLKTMLKDKDPRIVIWANLSTMALSQGNDATISLIAGYLKHKDPAVRRQACLALSAMGPSSRKSRDKVLDAMHDRDPGVALAAMTALVNQGDASPDILTAIKEMQDDKEAALVVREGARMANGALRKIKYNPEESLLADPQNKPTPTDLQELEGKDLRHWLEELHHTNKDPSLRERAINAIAAFKEASGNGEVITALIERINDKTDLDVSPRLRAIMVLNVIEIPSDYIPKVVEILSNRLKDTQRLIRYYSARALRHLGEDARPACAALAELVDDKFTWEVRRAALSALHVAGKSEKKGPDLVAVEALLKGASDRDCAEIRLEATYGLAVIGRPADATLASRVETQLQKLIDDKDRRVSSWARVGTMNLTRDDPDMISAIADDLKQADVPTRVNACLALTHLGPRATAVQDKLLESLNDKDNTVILTALNALVSLGQPSVLVLSGLREFNSRKDLPDPVREAGRLALDKLTKKK